jgi:hypothetical protein
LFKIAYKVIELNEDLVVSEVLSLTKLEVVLVTAYEYRLWSLLEQLNGQFFLSNRVVKLQVLELRFFNKPQHFRLIFCKCLLCHFQLVFFFLKVEDYRPIVFTLGCHLSSLSLKLANLLFNIPVVVKEHNLFSFLGLKIPILSGCLLLLVCQYFSCAGQLLLSSGSRKLLGHLQLSNILQELRILLHKGINLRL